MSIRAKRAEYGIFVLLGVILLLTLVPQVSYSYDNIINRLKLNKKLHIEKGPLVNGVIHTGAHSAMWIKERVPGTGYIRIRNRWKSHLYLHIEHGRLQAGAIKRRWHSAMWSLQRVPRTPYIRIRNRWKSNKYIHIKYGRVQAGTIQRRWPSAMWLFRAAGNRQASTRFTSSSRRQRPSAPRHNTSIPRNNRRRPSAPRNNIIGIQVTQASYGRNCRVRAGNVTHQLKRGCNGRVSCAYRVNHRVLGDPARGCRKDFLVYYRCGNSRSQKRAYIRGESSGRTIFLKCGTRNNSTATTRIPKVPHTPRTPRKPTRQNQPTKAQIKIKVQPFLSQNMCWKHTFGRGVGSVATACPRGQVKSGGFCYQRCRTGYSGADFLCWKNCPRGFKQVGPTCVKPKPYGRGAGYPWKFGDPAFKSKGQFARCQKRYGRGRCELSGAIVYPKCKRGYHKVGCCICSPNCTKGMRDLGVSCARPSYSRAKSRGIPRCGPGLKGDLPGGLGICRKPCGKNYKGVGPVCWMTQCPRKYPVDCGLGCAKSKQECVKGITSQVTTPLQMAANLTMLAMSGGSSAAVNASVKTAAKLATKAAITAALKAAAKHAGKVLSKAALKSAVKAVLKAQGSGKFNFADLDPTGIAGVVQAYAKPVCSSAR